ncbi:MAG: 16S rRNA (cytosine(1402)-N(4))-methyltransferase, partial [Merismopediaceae bacterium]|nr:16S rRNA (cytosine(1402)-N(4))-methyltransferase [Merismopediaceae bacterium]
MVQESLKVPRDSQFSHVSVLLEEMVANLAVVPGGGYLDATVGGGGHSAGLL